MAREHPRRVSVKPIFETLEPRLLLAAGLTGDYYDTTNLTGSVVTTRVDATVNFTEADWGPSGGPTGTSVTADDNYSERWTGWVNTPAAGSWTFYTNSNDGVRLWVDNSQIITRWNQHGATEDSATVSLSAGWHPIKLEHFQQDGTVVIQLSFSGPGQGKTIIPSTNLSTTDPLGLPEADAGPDKALTLPDNSTTLNGSGTDGGTITGYQWTKISGPAATLSGASTANLGLTNLVEGSYVFRLTVTDNDSNTAYDEANVYVFPVGGVGAITGELKTWHNVTVTFDGPVTSESAGTNPFTNYRLQVTFTGPSAQTYNVPGYYAADGNAANTSATAGNKWRVHFIPDEVGSWSYVASFRTGSGVAINLSPTAGSSAGYFDGLGGGFTVTATDKTGVDFRGKGMLKYVGEHQLQFAETGEYYLKGGADSPENFLAYWEFDGTYDTSGGASTPGLTAGLHRYPNHVSDWDSGDPTWQTNEGKGIIGAVNYLSDQGINSIYFLTYNIDGGDGRDTWMWTSDSERWRFDVSKLAQWEILFSHMDAKGVQLHVVTQETENDTVLGGNGGLNSIRKLYYRELVARFGHHLAVQWNLGEENDNSDAQRIAFANYIRTLDPYDHPIVVHTDFGTASWWYDGLLGNSNFEGTSIQGGAAFYNSLAIELRGDSAAAGRKWAVYGDEQGPNVQSDMSNVDTLRKTALWGNLMGGGAGVEWYFGYQGTFGDVQSEDWSVALPLWQYTDIALDFFQSYIPFWIMGPDNAATSVTTDYVLTSAGKVYASYLPNGGTTNVNLPSGDYIVKWYDPRNGGALQDGAVTSLSGGGWRAVGAAPSQTGSDWVVLVTKSTVVTEVRVNGISGWDVSTVVPVTASLEVDFSQPVRFDSDDVTLQEVTFPGGVEVVGATITPQSVSGSLSDTMTISFAGGAVINTWMKVTLSEAILGTGASALDGEAPAGGSGRGYLYDDAIDLPSGDGAPGGAAVFYVGDLGGDGSHDGQVSLVDYTIWAANYGSVQEDPVHGDYSGDGLVTLVDYTVWAANYGAALDALPVAPAPSLPVASTALSLAPTGQEALAASATPDDESVVAPSIDEPAILPIAPEETETTSPTSDEAIGDAGYAADIELSAKLDSPAKAPPGRAKAKPAPRGRAKGKGAADAGRQVGLEEDLVDILAMVELAGPLQQ